jgi:hypothetical protein
MRAMIRASMIAAALTIAVAAHADTTPTSTIAQVMVLESGDASYHLFHGAVWLQLDKATTNYRWGGEQCKGRDLSDASVQLLFGAFQARYQVKLEYVTSQLDGRSYRCITGFTVSRS